MIQFILIFIHEFQLFYKNDCDYPMGLSYFIAANAVIFFILFAHFYLKAYLSKHKQNKADVNQGITQTKIIYSQNNKQNNNKSRKNFGSSMFDNIASF